MNIAFIGAGKVGAPLAARLAEAGHQAVLAESGAESASPSAVPTSSPHPSNCVSSAPSPQATTPRCAANPAPPFAS